MTDVAASANLFVMTGGPGSGKSTLLEALKSVGYAVAEEAGRAIIREQRAIGGKGLPWKDPGLFAELMLSWELHSHAAASERSHPVIFDRGVPDVAGYLRTIGADIPGHVHRAADRCRYHQRVFIAPPWREIFVQDTERKQDFAEAVRTYEALAATYADYGYELIELPRGPVAERVAVVVAEIARAAAR